MNEVKYLCMLTKERYNITKVKNFNFVGHVSFKE